MNALILAIYDGQAPYLPDPMAETTHSNSIEQDVSVGSGRYRNSEVQFQNQCLHTVMSGSSV